jgi:hypothetical protein
MSNTSNPKVWITYAWADDREGNFAYLVQQLAAVGVQAEYDKVAIIPGRDLWGQIGDSITKGSIDGWAYLITPDSLASEACREELAYALSRALSSRGRNFPLIGLLHDVGIQDVPPPLKVRLCVSLANPDWKEQIKAGLEGRAPEVSPASQSQYVWKIRQGYRGQSFLKAIEVRPRFGEVMNWRFVVPKSVSVANWEHGPFLNVNSISENPASVVEHWGHGPSGGGLISDNKSELAFGDTLVNISSDDVTLNNDIPVAWFGAGNRLSPGTSAYAVLSGPLPEFIGFGPASESFGPPGQLEIRYF